MDYTSKYPVYAYFVTYFFYLKKYESIGKDQKAGKKAETKAMAGSPTTINQTENIGEVDGSDMDNDRLVYMNTVSLRSLSFSPP